MNLIKKTISILSICFFSLALALPVSAKVEGDTIFLGAAVSLSGKYSTNGEHTKNGYNMAVKRINDMGGVTVGGKSYKFDIIYYDDESDSSRAAQLSRAFNKTRWRSLYAWPIQFRLNKSDGACDRRKSNSNG